MYNYFGSEPEKKIVLTTAQKEVNFQTLKNRSWHQEVLRDPTRLAQKVKAAAARITTVELKIRHLCSGMNAIRLIMNDAISRFKRLDVEGKIDDPDAFGNYLEKGERAYNALAIQIELLRIAEVQSTVLNRVTAPEGDVVSDRSKTTIETSPSSECMTVEEAASYLRVSESTVYHRSALGTIPVNRIGSRLVFRKEDLESWLKNKA